MLACEWCVPLSKKQVTGGRMSKLSVVLCLLFAFTAMGYNLLLIDDYAASGSNSDFEELINRHILEDMSISYTYIYNNSVTKKTEDAGYLSSYNIILWNTWDRVISTAEKDALEDWVNVGRYLVVTGFDSLGSPTDPNAADLVRSTQSGDFSYTERYKVYDIDHWIINGTYEDAAGVEADFYTESTDHDLALPAADTLALAIVEQSGEFIGPTKIMVTENIGNGGIIVYWNGNKNVHDWSNDTYQPHLVNMFRNMMDYMCSINPPPFESIESVSWGQIKAEFSD
jgi:hypothetical protein